MIRPVQPGDFDGLMALLNWGNKRAVDSAHVPESIRRKLEGEDRSIFRLLALAAGEIIGQAALTLDYAAIPSTGLLTIMVRADQRGRDIGTILLGQLLSAASERLELSRVEVNVFSDNGSAIRLYQKLGFAEAARQLDSQGREIVLLARNLS